MCVWSDQGGQLIPKSADYKSVVPHSVLQVYKFILVYQNWSLHYKNAKSELPYRKKTISFHLENVLVHVNETNSQAESDKIGIWL